MDRISKLVEPWFTEHGRDLPWRNDRTPYRVWLSEIMLQQTQVGTVVGYYQRFLDKFPTLRDLATASEDEVLALWAGLGYYSRGRNLHKTAQLIMKEHEGAFPTDFNEIKKLPGIGSYTAGAICSFAFNKPEPVVDGNVARVLSRLFADKTPINAPASKSHYEQMSRTIVSVSKNPQACQEGLMELGATICVPNSPICESCPLSSICKANQQQITNQLPVKITQRKKTELHVVCVMLRSNTQIWLQKNTNTKLFGGLYSPLNITIKKPDHAIEAATKLLRDCDIDATLTGEAPICVKRTLTHRHLFLYGYRAHCRQFPVGGLSITKTELHTIGLSTAMKTLVDILWR